MEIIIDTVIIRRATEFLNPGQIDVTCLDQPVFALAMYSANDQLLSENKCMLLFWEGCTLKHGNGSLGNKRKPATVAALLVQMFWSVVMNLCYLNIIQTDWITLSVSIIGQSMKYEVWKSIKRPFILYYLFFTVVSKIKLFTNFTCRKSDLAAVLDFSDYWKIQNLSVCQIWFYYQPCNSNLVKPLDHVDYYNDCHKKGILRCRIFLACTF